MYLVIDTSVFITAWNSSEVHHRQTGSFFEQALDDDDIHLIVPELVVYEVANVLTRLGFGKKIREYLSVFEQNGMEIIPFSSELFDSFMHISTLLNLKTSDLIVCATASLSKAFLMTFKV